MFPPPSIERENMEEKMAVAVAVAGEEGAADVAMEVTTLNLILDRVFRLPGLTCDALR